ncbi:MAG: co-chaperone GroES, partial [Patescibacteria group bacterium]
IPETVSKEKPEQGKVIAAGPGRTTDQGVRVPMGVKKGDTILFSKYAPDEVKIDGEEYFIISESSILAVIE